MDMNKLNIMDITNSMYVNRNMPSIGIFVAHWIISSIE